MSAAPDNIRADLEAAIKQHSETPEVETPEVVETAAPVVEQETEAQKQERARDEKGRFVAKAADEPIAAPEKPEVQVAAPEKPVTPAAPEPEKPEQASLAPPNGWSAEAKAKWHELPSEIMAAVQKREQDVAKFTSTRDEHASFGKEMYQAVSPYLATIRAEGGTPKSAVEGLLNTAYLLRTGSPEQKKQLLLQTARQFGVDLGIPAQAGQVPDVVAPLYQEINQLKAQIQSREQEQIQRLQTEVEAEIAAFAADPKHSHYETVKGHMSALIAQGAAKDLQDAYEQAVWARPDTRATLLAQQRAEEEQKRQAEAKRRAEEARKKSISITGGPGNTASSTAPGSKGSVRDDLEAAFAAQSGSV